jgi:hypothetical protein
MPTAGSGTRTKKRPCTICRRWFQPEPQVVDRQRACNNPGCQTARRKKTQASWRSRNPEYAAIRRLDQRASQTKPPAEPLRLPKPLDQLPWDAAKDEFSPYGIDFIGVALALILRAAKDEIRSYLIDPTGLSGTLPLPPEKTRSGGVHTQPRATGVSPTRPPLGDATSPRPAPPAPPAGLTG